MMDNFIRGLSNYINQNNLIDQAFIDFRIAINNWKEASPKKYFEAFKGKGLEGMDVIVKEVSVGASVWPECERQYIGIWIAIYDVDEIRDHISFVGDYVWKHPISKKAAKEGILDIW